MKSRKRCNHKFVAPSLSSDLGAFLLACEIYDSFRQIREYKIEVAFSLTEEARVSVEQICGGLSHIFSEKTKGVGL